MELRDFVQLGEREPKLRALVIGGYAVAAHGHTRATFDVDFLVPRGDSQTWVQRGEAAGLRLFAQTNSFAQFSQPEGGDAFDLMFVADVTFEEMWQHSETKSFGDLRVQVPSLEHLLALKLHALKQALPHRTAKDASDVEMLIRNNKIDLAQTSVETLFLKYGSREIYETFVRLLRHP